MHFEWLEPSDDQSGAKIFDYPDLFREAARNLYDAALFVEALRFYQPLQQVPEYYDEACKEELEVCRSALGLRASGNAKKSKTNKRRKNKMSLGEASWAGGDESVNFESATTAAEADEALFDQHDPDSPADEGLLGQSLSTSGTTAPQRALLASALPKKGPKKAPKAKPISKDFEEQGAIERLFATRQHMSQSRQSEAISQEQWLSASLMLIKKFQSYKPFYYATYYLNKQQKMRGLVNKTLAVPGDQSDMENGERLFTLRDTFTDLTVQGNPSQAAIVKEYKGIEYPVWLDIFLEYALELARKGELDDAYQIVISARDASVFAHSQDSQLFIHICWFSESWRAIYCPNGTKISIACALMNDDDETLCNISRWFMREFQFASDGYRMYSALNRLSNSDHELFNCPPSQKHLLRQVKAMDFSLLGADRQSRTYQERASYSTKDAEGNPVMAEDMDATLLMLYGHVLYAGKGYIYAISTSIRISFLDLIELKETY